MAERGIEHTGIVEKISSDNIVTVSLLRVSACSTCHAKTACGVSESEQKIIEVASQSSGNLRVGEKVKIVMDSGLGMKALMLGYLFPFLLFLISLIVAIQFMGEAAAGLTALGIMIPYYLLLVLFRDKLKRTFTFRIMKI